MKLILILMAMISAPAMAEDLIKIAILDTGYTKPANEESVKLCSNGHKDFVENKKGVPPDNVGHGTNIAHILDNFLKRKISNYCLIIVKYVDSTTESLETGLRSNSALEYVLNLSPEFINYSGGGSKESKEETTLVKALLNKGIVFVAAAGNNGEDLDFNGFYPAKSDPRVIVVGALSSNKEKLQSSNYGNVVDRWELGESVKAGGKTLTGTSQATALATAKIVYEYIIKRSIE